MKDIRRISITLTCTREAPHDSVDLCGDCLVIDFEDEDEAMDFYQKVSDFIAIHRPLPEGGKL